MDEKWLSELIKEKVTSRELKVIIAMKLGYVDTYDIQLATGLKKFQVENAQDGQTINKFIGSLKPTRSTAQNGQKIPTNRLLDYLYESLNRPVSYIPKEQMAAKRVYTMALEACGRNQAAAMQLLGDCINVNLPTFAKTSYPCLYLQTVFTTYLGAYPSRKPKLVLEQEALTGIRQRFNPNLPGANKWEAARAQA